MFLLIRVFHVHAHEHGDTSDVVDEHPRSRHEGPCEHHHEHHRRIAAGPASLQLARPGLRPVAAHADRRPGPRRGGRWRKPHEQHGFALFGLGTFLAVALHKPLDALSITSLMAAGGWSKGRSIWPTALSP